MSRRLISAAQSGEYSLKTTSDCKPVGGGACATVSDGASVRHNNQKKMVGRVGLEPTTNALKGRCSTD
jgi:hypothetical protein